MTRALALCFAAAALLGCREAPPSVAAKDVPAVFDVSKAPDGPVLDEANLLTPSAEADLDAGLRDWFDRTGTPLVVVIVKSLEGQTIERVAFETFNSWGIGTPEGGDGLLLLVAPRERKVRIEVGCSLERVMTNHRAAGIIREDITPHFRAGRMEAGIVTGAEAIMATTDTYRAEAGPSLSPLCNEKKAA